MGFRRIASKGLRAALLAGFFAGSSLLTVGTAGAQDKVLRVNMHSDLKIVDPIWTTAYMSRNYGYMVYDTLFAINTKGEVKPQMVDTHTISDDGLTYDFTLRDGLMFHDDQPVTSADVIASLERWGQKLSLIHI